MRVKQSKRSAKALLYCMALPLMPGCSDKEDTLLDAMQTAVERYTQCVFRLSVERGIEGKPVSQLPPNSCSDTVQENMLEGSRVPVATTFGYPEASIGGLGAIIRVNTSWTVTNPDIQMPHGFATIMIVSTQAEHTDTSCGLVYSIDTTAPQPPLIKQHCW